MRLQIDATKASLSSRGMLARSNTGCVTVRCSHKLLAHNAFGVQFLGHVGCNQPFTCLKRTVQEVSDKRVLHRPLLHCDSGGNGGRVLSSGSLAVDATQYVAACSRRRLISRPLLACKWVTKCLEVGLCVLIGPGIAQAALALCCQLV